MASGYTKDSDGTVTLNPNDASDEQRVVKELVDAGMPEAQAQIIASNFKLIWQPPTPPGGPP